MKVFLIVLACLIGYISMALLTLFLMVLYDRLGGWSEQACYEKNYNEYVLMSLLSWWLVLPFVLGIIIFDLFKKWMIFAIERIVAIKKEKENAEDNQSLLWVYGHAILYSVTDS